MYSVWSPRVYVLLKVDIVIVKDYSNSTKIYDSVAKMSLYSRPEAVIKVYPKDYYEPQKTKILQFLIKTNALVLQLQENVSGSVYRTPYPFITFKRISNSDKLPKNLKTDGDPLSDYFVTLKSLKMGEKSGKQKSGFVILAYKVTDDDRTIFYDQTWETWSGTAALSSKLATQYEIRKIVCFKGTVFENL